MSGISVVMHELCLSYSHEIPIVEGVSLDIPPGTILGIFGPNGCGKSTLFRALCGELPAADGSLLFDGNKVHPLRRMGIVFQDFSQSLLPWRTCVSNIALPLERNAGSSRSNESRVKGMLQRYKLSLPLGSFPKHMSGGQKQMTCVMRAMITDPGLLLLDEPFGSLDYMTRLSLIASIESVCMESKVTTIVVSHELNDLLLLADRVVLLSSRPAKVVADFCVNLPRPRLDYMLSSEAVILRDKIVSTFMNGGRL